MPDLILSASSISTYLQCHYRYLLSNVYRVGGVQSAAAALGTAVHAAVEAFWKATPTRPQAILERVLTAELAKVPQLDEPAEVLFADGTLMLTTYMTKVVPTFRPTLVEQTFVIEVDGVYVSGTIDAADDDVHDTKTTSGKTINGNKPSFYPESYDLQLSIYALGYQVLTGRKPKRLLLDVVTRRGTYRQYERQPQMGDLLDVLGVVSDGIIAEDYEPTGATGGACHYCPYRAICRYSTER